MSINSSASSICWGFLTSYLMTIKLTRKQMGQHLMRTIQMSKTWQSSIQWSPNVMDFETPQAGRNVYTIHKILCCKIQHLVIGGTYNNTSVGFPVEDRGSRCYQSNPREFSLVLHTQRLLGKDTPPYPGMGTRLKQ